MSKVYCVNCGAEVIIPEHSSMGFGMSISQKDTTGTYYVPTKTTEYGTNVNHNTKENKTMTKAEARIATLKAAGIDTTNYFAAGDVVIKMENGIPTIVPEDDVVVKDIYDAGYVHNNRLDGRFVMAQMFRMLRDRDGYTGALNRYDYNYCLKRMTEEVRVLSKLQYTDRETFEEFVQFFNLDVVVATCEHHIEMLRKYLSTRKVKRHKGRPYITIPYYRWYHVDELDARLYAPLISILLELKEMDTRWVSYTKVYNLLCEFNRKTPKLPWTTTKSKVWVDAFKGKGAYMTMKNMIKFHDCKFKGDRTAADSLITLEKYTKKYYQQGWRLLGVLKEFINDNDFDFKDRMKELGIRCY